MISKVLISAIGEKKFRYGVKNPSEVATKQSNITNTIKKFLDA